jgi:hypothetical protein
MTIEMGANEGKYGVDVDVDVARFRRSAVLCCAVFYFQILLLLLPWHLPHFTNPTITSILRVQYILQHHE